MDREEYLDEIVLKVVEELKKLNQDQNMDLIELLKNNVSVQILPMDLAEVADEKVPKDESDMKEIMELQKEIMDRVICELQKSEHSILLN